MRPNALRHLLVLLVTLSALHGCGRKPAEVEQSLNNDSQLPPVVAAELNALPDDVRLVVEAQRICPVSEELLGSMGKPVSVTVEDRVVYLCCSSCEGEIRTDPEKYFAKIPAVHLTP